ncbi:hypothetical protein HDU98_008671 [Podochytrium sp. JEL0797]|nr:hypothetical protein HDU98_008671 [Podochytrium sp. JEL0797]
MIPLFLALALLLATECLAHGMMCWPYIRATPGDPQNGWTLARRRFNDVIGGGPCHGLPKSSPLTPPLLGGKTKFDYILTATHRGNCSIYLNRGKGEVLIGTDPTCGVHAAPFRSSITVNLPKGNYQGYVRWLYQTDNASGELFDSCADVTVSTHGSNARTEDACKRTPLWWPETCSGGQSMCTFASGASPSYQTCRGGDYYPVDCAPGNFCVMHGGKAVCKKMAAVNPNGRV